MRHKEKAGSHCDADKSGPVADVKFNLRQPDFSDLHPWKILKPFMIVFDDAASEVVFISLYHAAQRTSGRGSKFNAQESSFAEVRDLGPVIVLGEG